MRAWRRWWWAPDAAADSLTLTQRNVYILPPRAGWMLALTLMVLLVASINYQLNLGTHSRSCWLAAPWQACIVCHGTLRGWPA